MLITWLVFMISGLADGLASDNASAIKNLPAKAYILEHSDDHRLERSTITSDQVKKVLNGNESEEVSPFGIVMTTLSAKNGDHKWDVSLFAVKGNSIFAPSVSQGNTLASGNGVIVDASLKDKGVKIGDILKPKDGSYQLKVAGFTDKSYSYSHVPVVFMSLDKWKDIQQQTVRYNAILIGKNATGLHQPSGMDKVQSDEVLKNVPGFGAEQASLKMMIGFLLVITAFVLAVFFYVITLQKIDQYGVLKAIGTKTGYLVKTLMLQMLMLSLASIAFGTGLSFIAAAVIPKDMPFVLSNQTIIFDGLLILVMALVGSLISLIRIAKVDPIEAIGSVK